jgi:RNA polymerase-binding transcription factor DksA
MPADPISCRQAELVRHHGAADLSERADQHIERELLQSENDRLKNELKRAESALRAAGRLLAPYVNK